MSNKKDTVTLASALRGCRTQDHGESCDLRGSASEDNAQQLLKKGDFPNNYRILVCPIFSSTEGIRMLPNFYSWGNISSVEHFISHYITLC